MFRQLLLVLLMSTTSMFALEAGETLSSKIIEELNMKPKTLYVIDFFASWCHSCKKELPLVNKVYEDKIVKVIGVNVDKEMDDGISFVQKLSLSFPMVYDCEQELINNFEPIGFPTLYFIKDGKILDTLIGAKKNIDKIIIQKVKELK